MKSRSYLYLFSILLLTCLTHLNQVHAAADFKIEKVQSDKRFLKKQKRVKKLQEKLAKKSSNYGSFDYNILLGISLVIIASAIIVALFGSWFSLLLLVFAGLLLLIAISNNCHWIAWWALIFSALLFYPIFFSLRDYD